MGLTSQTIGQQAIVQPSTIDTLTASAVLEAQRTLVQVREALEPALRAAVARLPESMRALAAYHLGWCDEQGAVAVEMIHNASLVHDDTPPTSSTPQADMGH